MDNAASQSAPHSRGDESHLGACRASVAKLRRLLDLVFPDAQHPDILTVEDVIRRYPLTQLGAPATAAIEQSRRITRVRRDFQQMGLAEFHAGLIYLYWGDSRAAVQQFAAARTQWSLAGDAAPGCLAHFAQGMALQHGYHFEAAMSQFGLTERCLGRNPAGFQAHRLGELGEELWPLLEAAQQAVRPKLWPEETSAGAAAPAGATEARATVNHTVAADTPPPVSTPASPEAAVADAPRNQNGPPVPMPISNMAREFATFPAGPVPGHDHKDDRYRWYVVHKRRDALLPDITEGTWILVDSDPPAWADGAGEELVVIGGPRPDLGSVAVRPRTTMLQQPYCYLGYRTAAGRDAAASGGRGLVLDDSGHALAIPDAILLGIVVGFWHSVIT